MKALRKYSMMLRFSLLFALFLLGIPNCMAGTLTNSIGVPFPNGIYNGRWGDTEFCGAGHVVGMRLKLHNDWFDDLSDQLVSNVGNKEMEKGSGVTGVEFYCSSQRYSYNSNQSHRKSISMQEHGAGQWQPPVICPDGKRVIGLSINIPSALNSTQPLRPIQGVRMYCDGGSERDKLLLYTGKGANALLYVGHEALRSSYMRRDAMMKPSQVLAKNWGGMAICPEKNYMCGFISMGMFDTPAANIGIYDMVMYCCKN